MARHGSESYFVLGEGLLGEALEGRSRPLAAAMEAATVPFRFSRMGPSGAGHQLPDGVLKKVANAIVAGAAVGSKVPAGFTYLGQFVDHDLTFDKTNVMLGEAVSPTQLLQARSPTLDLDSLYGAGPADPKSARFYEEDGVHLRMGKTTLADGLSALDGFDLPRGRGTSAVAKRRAVIPDPRNDENLAVAQTHLAFIRFHNRVVDRLPASVPQSQRFAQAREVVTKHYQWMLRTDYLPRICRAAVVNNVFAKGRKLFEVGATPTDVPTMPIEFSVAAFRLGHSMIRSSYNWNKIFDDGSGSLELLFTFSGLSGDLGVGPRLPSNWIADFRRLFDFNEAARPSLIVPENKFNRAMRIDTTIELPLKTLPGFPLNEANLALRNLRRAKMVKLATGQQMVEFLKEHGVNVTALATSQVLEGKNGAKMQALTEQQRASFASDTPLWFYILREAELNQGRLSGVGARIVAETFHRAMEGSQASIVREPDWRPTLGPDNETFRMVDLLLFAFRRRKNLLAPVG